MVPNLRRRFNAAFTPEKYRRFLELLDAGSGTHVKFRNSETPCFFPRALIDQMARDGVDLIEQLMTPEYLARSEETIPAKYRVPNEDTRPLFIQVDFGLNAQNEPKLVEIQGFPSLYAYQPFLADCYRRAYDLGPGPPALRCGWRSIHSHKKLCPISCLLRSIWAFAPCASQRSKSAGDDFSTTACRSSGSIIGRS